MAIGCHTPKGHELALVVSGQLTLLIGDLHEDHQQRTLPAPGSLSFMGRGQTNRQSCCEPANDKVPILARFDPIGI